MDFITQNLLGAVAGHAIFGRRSALDGEAPRPGLGRLALAAGGLGGAVPDFDFLLKPFADPALPMEFHRHFTHALLFIPLGGLLATLPLLALPAARRQAGRVLAAATVGCATHGLLDNTTSYGTHLLWPFLGGRTAWDSMAIVDPVFSGVLLLGIAAALVRGRRTATRIALGLALTYIGFGFVQHARAMDVQRSLAVQREHDVVHRRVMPTLGNVVVFRSLYEAEGRLWADAIRIAPFGRSGVRTGTSIPRVTEADLSPDATDHERSVFRRFDAFADGFTGRIPGADDAIFADMRISMATDGFRPLWGIRMTSDGTPVAWNGFNGDDGAGRDLAGLGDDLFRPGDRFVPFGPRAARED